MPALEGQFLKEISVRFGGENHLRTQKTHETKLCAEVPEWPLPKDPFFQLLMNTWLPQNNLAGALSQMALQRCVVNFLARFLGWILESEFWEVSFSTVNFSGALFFLGKNRTKKFDPRIRVRNSGVQNSFTRIRAQIRVSSAKWPCRGALWILWPDFWVEFWKVNFGRRVSQRWIFQGASFAGKNRSK